MGQGAGFAASPLLFLFLLLICCAGDFRRLVYQEEREEGIGQKGER